MLGRAARSARSGPLAHLSSSSSTWGHGAGKVALACLRALRSLRATGSTPGPLQPCAGRSGPWSFQDADERARHSAPCRKRRPGCVAGVGRTAAGKLAADRRTVQRRFAGGKGRFGSRVASEACGACERHLAGTMSPGARAQRRRASGRSTPERAARPSAPGPSCTGGVTGGVTASAARLLLLPGAQSTPGAQRR